MKKAVSILIIFILSVSCNNQNQSTMSTNNEALIEQYFTHFNNHDWKKMAEMYTETAAFKDPSLGPGVVTQTRQQTIEKYQAMSETFPDLHDKVLQTYPSGEEHLIVEFVSSGTAPDGSPFALPICTIFTIEDGLITQDFTYYDNFEE